MIIKKTTEGYILVLTLMILALMIILASQLAQQGIIHIYFDRTMIEKEQAKRLALSGVQLCISQLSTAVFQPQSEKSKTPSAENKEVPGKKLLEIIFPVLNQWQEFKLTQESDGIDGTIAFAVCCENGKLDINTLFDFKQKKFINENQPNNDAKKILQEFFNGLRKFTQDKNLFEPFEKFLKQRTSPLNDVTELLEIPDFQKVFKSFVFYQPPVKDSKEKRSIYLTDIFTVWSNRATLQPWFLSDSITASLNLKRIEYDEQEKRKRQIKEIVAAFTGFNQPIDQIWDKQLKPFYGKEFKAIAQSTKEIFATYEPTTFSVICHGSVGNVTQKVFAILQKRSSGTDQEEGFIIKKLYWL